MRYYYSKTKMDVKLIDCYFLLKPYYTNIFLMNSKK